MQHSSRDDGDRRRPAGLMIVRAPFVSVLRPGPAQMMHVGPFETKRALLKVGMGMRRKLAAIARPVAWVDVIDHEVGRADQPAEPAFLLRHVHGIPAHLVASYGIWP